MSQSSGDNPITGTGSASSATQLPGQECITALIQCDPNSANNLYVGNSAAQCIQLKPGQAITINCSNLNDIYVAGNGGSATYNWMTLS